MFAGVAILCHLQTSMELHIHSEHSLCTVFPIPPPSLLCMMPPIKPPSQLSFAEEPSSSLFFPEFCELSSSVTSLDMRVIGTQRLTVFGCQNGYLQCSLVNITAGSKFAPGSSARTPSICDAYPSIQRCCAAGLVRSWMGL